MSAFIPYERFATIQDINEFVELLKSNNIPYELEDDIAVFDVSFANNQLHRDYGIKLLPGDFERVTELRSTIALPELSEIDPEYYLFGFSDAELLDLIEKRDEWSPLDYRLAQLILKERGKEVSAETIARLQEKRIEELSEPDKQSSFWVGAGYIFAFLGGVIGLGIGWYILTNKKTLPNGERIHTFKPSDRNHGAVITVISGLLTITAIALKLIGAYRFLF